MPEQRQIFRGAVTAAPDDYTIDANVELTLRAVTATFTDNGAGGDWLPSVELLSDSGHLIARAVDQAVKVTAGGSAEVSWFPGVKHSAAAAVAASSAPSVATFYRSAFRRGDAPQTVGAGATANLVWPNAALPSNGYVTGPTIGNVFAQYATDCITVQYLYVGWENGNYKKAAVIGTNSRDIPADIVSSSNYIPADSPLRVDSNDWTSYPMPNAAKSGDLLHAYAINGDVIDRDVNEAWLVIHLWPVTGYTGIIPRWPQ